jgi:hypothetical protein
VRAKLRADLLELSGARGTWGSHVLDGIAGRSLAVENVTVHSVTLRLPRPTWEGKSAPSGNYSLGMTLISVPHEWLAADVTKTEWVNFCSTRGGSA